MGTPPPNLYVPVGSPIISLLCPVVLQGAWSLLVIGPQPCVWCLGIVPILLLTSYLLCCCLAIYNRLFTDACYLPWILVKKPPTSAVSLGNPRLFGIQVGLPCSSGSSRGSARTCWLRSQHQSCAWRLVRVLWVHQLRHFPQLSQTWCFADTGTSLRGLNPLQALSNIYYFPQIPE